MVSKYERGQAIILIAFAIVGLIAIVALAIDGGNVFLDRRRAQNAADTAAYAAALARIEAQKVKHPRILTEPEIYAILNPAAIDRASSNGYTVTAVNNPPKTGCGGSTNPYIIAAGDSPAVQDLKQQYIQVIINSTVNTYFAPIVGIRTLNNCVEAIARAKPGDPLSLCYGALICALSKTDSRALRLFGGAEVTLWDGGAFSNSNDTSAAAYISSNSTLKMYKLTVPPTNPPTPLAFGITTAVGGGIDASSYTGLKFPSGAAQLSYPLPDFMIPIYTCDYTYNNLPDDLPGGRPFLKDGVYCVTGNFTQANYRNVPIDETTGSHGTGIGGVTIVMLNKGFSWAGTLYVILNAPPCSNSSCTRPQTAGLLVYLPYGNKNNTVKFAGSGNLKIEGTILAPDTGSLIHYSGNYDTATFKSQLVGWNLEFGGTAGGGIYLHPIIFVYPGDARVELVK